MALTEASTSERVARVDAELARVEAIVDPRSREAAVAAVQGLLEFYAEGLERLVVGATERLGPATMAELAEDPLVACLLLLHGLHPVPLADRIRAALDDVQPYLASHGGGVALIDASDGVARLELHGSCRGCRSSAATLELAVERAIRERAPDIERIEVRDGEADGSHHTGDAVQGAPSAMPAPSFIPLELVANSGPRTASAAARAPDPSWVTAGPADSFLTAAASTALLRSVDGVPLLFVAVNGSLYAYGPNCPACDASLDHARVSEAGLACPGCGHRFDARRAGRSLDGDASQLDAVPLLVSAEGIVRVALDGNRERAS